MNRVPLLEPLAPTQLAELRSALAGEGLPHDDIEADGCRFYRARHDNEIVGYVGLQGNGPDRLLRSMWVRPDQRRRGTGSALLELVERTAADGGCQTLHLLTTTANAFFARHGYISAERSRAPEGIASTREFLALCPASASYLIKSLGNPA